jgi:hypothetical protein
MKQNLIIFVLLYSQFVYAQEINKPLILQNPRKIETIRINKMMDSLSLFRLNSDFYKNSFSSNKSFDTAIIKKQTEEKQLQNLLGSYPDFKRKFLALEFKDPMLDLHLPKAKGGTPKMLDPNFINSLGFLINSPISFFYCNFSKEEQSLRKAYALNADMPNRRCIDAKYNKEKVQLWTGLKDKELTKFVMFCNFDDAYLLRANEYDLIDNILKKLTEFKAIQDSCNYNN